MELDGEAPSPAPEGPAAGVRYSEALAASICERVAAGESVRAICAGADAPSTATLHRWMQREPTFAQALAMARRRARRDFVASRRARRSAALLARKHPWGRKDAFTEAVGEEICGRIALGESLLSVCSDPRMPVPGTVYGWLTAHDDFAARYATAREVQAELLADHAWEVARAAERPGEVPAARLKFDVIRWRAAKLAPKAYGARGEWLAAQDGAGGGPLQVFIQRFSDGAILAGPKR